MQTEYTTKNVRNYLEHYYELDHPLPYYRGGSDGGIPKRKRGFNAPWELAICIKVDLDTRLPLVVEPYRGVLTMLYLVGYLPDEVAQRYRVSRSTVFYWQKKGIKLLTDWLNGFGAVASGGE